MIAVAGRPNAGKSTLVNHLVGEHVAIVSPIAQTTRRLVRAACTFEDAQLVFVDLPGSQKPLDRMTERMQEAVERSLGDVDAVLWVVDMSVPLKGGERWIAELVLSCGRPVVIAANKIDRMDRAALAQRIGQLDALIAQRDYEAIIPVSAVTGDGCSILASQLAEMMPEGPQLFPAGEITDMRDDERISELIREATLAHLREELPHASAVEVRELDHSDGRLQIEAIIWVENDSQVGIVVGSRGATIAAIGTAARAEIARAFATRVHLDLRVKNRKHWRNDERLLGNWGL